MPDQSDHVVALAFPAAVTANAISLDICGTITYSEWERLGQTLFTLARFTPWAIADWYNAGENYFGEEAAQAVADLGLDLHTVQNYAWVGLRFEPARRRLELSPAHHAEVAALSPDVADAWLQAAVDNEWSRATLRAELRAARQLARAEEMEEEAAQNGGVVQLPPPITGRGLVEVNGGLAYVGLTALGDLLRTLEGYEVEYSFRVVGTQEED